MEHQVKLKPSVSDWKSPHSQPPSHQLLDKLALYLQPCLSLPGNYLDSAAACILLVIVLSIRCRSLRSFRQSKEEQG